MPETFIADKQQNTAILQPQRSSQIIVQFCDVVGAGIPMNVLLFESTCQQSCCQHRGTNKTAGRKKN